MKTSEREITTEHCFVEEIGQEKMEGALESESANNWRGTWNSL